MLAIHDDASIFPSFRIMIGERQRDDGGKPSSNTDHSAVGAICCSRFDQINNTAAAAVQQQLEREGNVSLQAHALWMLAKIYTISGHKIFDTHIHDEIYFT